MSYYTDLGATTPGAGVLADQIAASLKLPWQEVMQAIRAGCKSEAEVRTYLQRVGAMK
jgi:hypothetical protein